VCFFKSKVPVLLCLFNNNSEKKKYYETSQVVRVTHNIISENNGDGMVVWFELFDMYYTDVFNSTQKYNIMII